MGNVEDEKVLLRMSIGEQWHPFALGWFVISGTSIVQRVRFVKFVISGPYLRSFPFVGFGTLWIVSFYGISELRAIFDPVTGLLR